MATARNFNTDVSSISPPSEPAANCKLSHTPFLILPSQQDIINESCLTLGLVFFFFVFLRHRRKILPIWRYLVLLLDIYNKSEAQLWCFFAGEELSPLPGESNFFRRFSKDSNIPSNDNTPHKGTKNIQRAESLPSDRRRVDINSGTHQKTASQPIGKTDSFILQTNYNMQTSNNNKNVSSKKLEEYHKWKVSGCKGDPPAKLKISQWVVVVVVFFFITCHWIWKLDIFWDLKF